MRIAGKAMEKPRADSGSAGTHLCVKANRTPIPERFAGIFLMRRESMRNDGKSS
jgi:hypothetical protein